MKMLRTAFIAILSIAALSACNSLIKSGSKQSSKTQLSFKETTSTSNSMTTADSTSTNANMMVITDPHNDTLKIDTAKVMIREIEFHGSEKMRHKDHNYGDYTKNNEDSTEFEPGPFVLDLNLDTTLTTIAINKLPDGTYNYISFQIHKPLPNQNLADSDFVGGPNNEQRFSIVIKGTYNSKPFVFKTPRTIRIHTKINPPLTVSDSLGSYNATINVDVGKWFVNKNGYIIDPTNPNNVYEINWSIQRSFYAFKDNNHDGHEDHDGWGWKWKHHNEHSNQDSTKTDTTSSNS
ncbi:MAG TPA: DUF4382 domain-containing protein [Balneolales bacterium]|nr:DUF4382 domain-containing protein [Balneolales bacterium]